MSRSSRAPTCSPSKSSPPARGGYPDRAGRSRPAPPGAAQPGQERRAGLRAAAGHRGKGAVRLSARQRGDESLLAVWNRGAEISPETSGRLFGPSSRRERAPASASPSSARSPSITAAASRSPAPTARRRSRSRSPTDRAATPTISQGDVPVLWPARSAVRTARRARARPREMSALAPSSVVGEPMHHETQVEIVQRILDHVRARTTDLAGASHRQPTSAYHCPDRHRRELDACSGGSRSSSATPPASRSPAATSPSTSTASP